MLFVRRQRRCEPIATATLWQSEWEGESLGTDARLGRRTCRQHEGKVHCQSDAFASVTVGMMTLDLKGRVFLVCAST